MRPVRETEALPTTRRARLLSDPKTFPQSAIVAGKKSVLNPMAWLVRAAHLSEPVGEWLEALADHQTYAGSVTRPAEVIKGVPKVTAETAEGTGQNSGMGVDLKTG